MISTVVGDAFAYMENMEDESVDAVITDMPYDLDRAKVEQLASEANRISRGHVLCFCAPENQFPAPRYLFWVKPTSTKNFSKSHGRFVEMIGWIPKGDTFNQLFWANMTGVYTDVLEGPKNGHPYRKPLALMERLVEIHTNPGDMIIDPFAGSGTTLKAAKNLRRNAIGVEIDPQWVDISVP